jgi:DNA-binding transcriptional MerR regulator
MSRSTPDAPEISIGELSRRSGASPRMLRYYEQQGLLASVRADNGYRRYCPDTVVTVTQIRGLLDAGLSTDTIRQILPCASGPEPTIDLCPEIVSALMRERDRLDDRIRNLSDSRAALDTYLRAARHPHR